jgi:hypothetical protein
MEAARASVVDEGDVLTRIRVHGPIADVEIPPIVGGKKRQSARERAAANRIHRVRRAVRPDKKEQRRKEKNRANRPAIKVTKESLDHRNLSQSARVHHSKRHAGEKRQISVSSPQFNMINA